MHYLIVPGLNNSDENLKEDTIIVAHSLGVATTVM